MGLCGKNHRGMVCYLTARAVVVWLLDYFLTYGFLLKSCFRKAGNETLTKCKRFRLEAADGKRRLTDCLPQKMSWRQRCRML